MCDVSKIKNIEKAKCLACGHEFFKRKLNNKRPYLRIVVRSVRAKTCSPKCSRHYTFIKNRKRDRTLLTLANEMEARSNE